MFTLPHLMATRLHDCDPAHVRVGLCAMFLIVAAPMRVWVLRSGTRTSEQCGYCDQVEVVVEGSRRSRYFLSCYRCLKAGTRVHIRCCLLASLPRRRRQYIRHE